MGPKNSPGTNSGTPVYLLVCTPEQFERRLAIGDGFIREMTSGGKVLYEAAHERVG